MLKEILHEGAEKIEELLEAGFYPDEQLQRQRKKVEDPTPLLPGMSRLEIKKTVR